MSSFAETMSRVTTLTFDCYGTLIDWKGGLMRSFAVLLGEPAMRGFDDLLATYVTVEHEVESGPYRSYREVLSIVAARLGESVGVDVSPERAETLARMLPDWPPFADTNDALRRLKERFRLGILSNVDRDLFAETARHFDVAFDFVVTAEDVRSYKPDHGHFERLLSEHAEREKVLHVAQSTLHDGTATRELGIAWAWINRYKEARRDAVTPLAEFADLLSLAAAIEEK